MLDRGTLHVVANDIRCPVDRDRVDGPSTEGRVAPLPARDGPLAQNCWAVGVPAAGEGDRLALGHGLARPSVAKEALTEEHPGPVGGGVGAKADLVPRRVLQGVAEPREVGHRLHLRARDDPREPEGVPHQALGEQVAVGPGVQVPVDAIREGLDDRQQANLEAQDP